MRGKCLEKRKGEWNRYLRRRDMITLMIHAKARRCDARPLRVSRGDLPDKDKGQIVHISLRRTGKQ